MGMLDTGMAVLTDSGGTRPGWRFVAALEVLSAIGFVAFFMRKGADCLSKWVEPRGWVLLQDCLEQAEWTIEEGFALTQNKGDSA